MDASWVAALSSEFQKPYFATLRAFVGDERKSHVVFPPSEDTFNAFKLTPLGDTRVLILGQDPYFGPGQAHGLSFSVRPKVPIPPSLKNIYRELETDLGIPVASHGNLTHWAMQGVLLLNATLTVRSGEAGSHQGYGWEKFTDQVIRVLNDRERTIVFLLWGSFARQKKDLISNSRHVILEAPHPSPRSAHTGFFGSRPFSKTNEALDSAGLPKIDWVLPKSMV